MSLGEFPDFSADVVQVITPGNTRQHMPCPPVHAQAMAPLPALAWSVNSSLASIDTCMYVITFAAEIEPTLVHACEPAVALTAVQVVQSARASLACWRHRPQYCAGHAWPDEAERACPPAA